MTTNHYLRITILLLTMLIVATWSAAAAEWRVSGRVTDAAGETMPGVVIKMTDDKGQTVAFCSTVGSGAFTLTHRTKPDATWSVGFALIGYETKTYTVGSMTDGMTVVLAEAPFELKEVVVKIPPIKSHGDTLTYDVASFRSAADRNIEDVIKKLPGVEVNEKGGIYYNGEPINRFYIEGLDVVAGRYTIATRNISPDDILSINVYENHQPKKVLKDIQFSEKAAINLKMKKKSMLKPVGYVRGGGGCDDDGDAKWLGELFGMFIAPSKQVLVTAKGNNTGNSYLTETQSHLGGGSAKSVASDLYGETPFGSAQIPSERYFDNTSTSVSVNAISKFGEHGKVGITADYAGEDNSSVNSESIVYSNGDDPAILLDETIVNNPQTRRVKFRADIENNAPTKYFSNKFSFAGRFADHTYDIADLSSPSSAADIAQQSRTDNYSFANSLDGTLRIGKSLISFDSDIAVVNTPVSRLRATNVADGSPLVEQRGEALTFTTAERIGYSWMLGAYSHIGANLRFDSAYDVFKSAYTAATASPSTPASTASATVANNVRGYDITTTVEPEYQFKPDSWYSLKLQLPIRFTAMDYTDRIAADADRSIGRTDLGVRASFNFKPSYAFRGSLVVGRQTSLGSIRDFIVNPVYTTYRNRSTFGFGELGIRENYTVSTNLFYRDPVRAFFVTLTSLYRRGSSNYLRGSDVSSSSVSSTVRDEKNTNDLINSGISISKNVRPWRTTFTLDANFEQMRRRIMRQGVVRTVVNTSYVLHAAVKGSPAASVIDFGVEGWYKPSVQKITSLGVRNRADDIVTQATLSVHPVKSVEIYSQLYWNHVSILADAAKESLFVGGGIRWHSGHFDVELSGKNLTNEKTYAYSYFVDSDCYSYSFRLRPIEFLASVKWTF